MSQQNNTDNPASAATGSNDGVGTQQQTAQDDNTVKTQGQRQKRSNDVNTRDNESKENGSNDNPNEQTSNDEINKSNRSNKAEMKTENESQDSEFLVFVRSLRIPFEKEMIDELRDEEFDLVEMAKAQPPNHSGIVAFGKSIGFTGDKLGYFAEKLATKLVNKYGNTQSNGNGDRAGSRIETFNLRFQKKQKIVTEEVMYNHDDPSSINIVQALKIKYPNYSPYLDSDGDKSINHDKQFFDNKDSILHLVITKFSLASNVSPTQRKIATLNSLLTDDMRDRIKTNSDENDTTHMLESGLETIPEATTTVQNSENRFVQWLQSHFFNV